MTGTDSPSEGERPAPPPTPRPGVQPTSSVPEAPKRAESKPPPPKDGVGSPILHRLQTAIGETVIGYEDAVVALAIALSCDGHVLLEGLPGLAKTYLVRSFARALDLSYRRIQFTPDMLPLDIVGNVVLNPKTQQFEFRAGPVFCNVLLADEINRAPPKVQSALLESMQEFQVTVEGRSYPLPRPFLVIATQNPLDQEGTYPLPEAQLDRFLFRYLLQYPGREDEVRILTTQGAELGREVPPRIVSQEEVAALRARHRDTFVHPDIFRYIADIVRETRKDPRIMVGASPRAGVHLMLAARAMAILDDRRYVLPDDVRALAFSVLNHRIILRPEVKRGPALDANLAGSAGVLREVVGSVIDRVKAPR
jgi:MoxR-like ATPase